MVFPKEAVRFSNFKAELYNRNVFCEKELKRFILQGRTRYLNWPEEVVKELLWTFGDHSHIIATYNHIDLTQVEWLLEDVPTKDFLTIESDASGLARIEQVENELSYVMGNYPVEVRDHWTNHHTWRASPLIFVSEFGLPTSERFFAVEGRTRIGALRGRVKKGLTVATDHSAWVGRKRN